MTKFLNLFEQGINDHCQWQSECDANNEAWLIWRDLLHLAEVFITETGNNLISEGNNIYHNTSFDELNDIHIITANDTDIISNYGLQIGDRYAIESTPATLVLSGDEAYGIPNLPEDVKGMNCLFLRILTHNMDMIHSPHFGMVALYAAKHARHYDENMVIAKIQELFENIGQSGFLKYYNPKRNFWVCFPFNRHEGGDWPWIHKFITRSTNQNSTYPFIEITKCDAHGDLTNVKNDNIELYACLIGTHIPCFELTNLRQLYVRGQTRYTITPTIIASMMGSQVDDIVIEEKNDALNDDSCINYDSEYEHKRRSEIAKSLGHGILHNIGNIDLRFLFDSFHFMWRFPIRMISTLVTIMWCVWGFHKNHVLMVLNQLGNEFLTSQFEQWMDNNADRMSYKPCEIKTRGKTCKQTLNKLPFAITMAMHIATHYDYQRNENIDIILTVLCVMYYVCVLMTQSICILFKKQYTSISADGRSEMIELMIDMVNLATYVSYHLCNVLVE